MKNLDIRKLIKDSKLKHWQVAEVAGISASTLCVWLRSDLTDERRKLIVSAIARIQTEGLFANE